MSHQPASPRLDTKHQPPATTTVRLEQLVSELLQVLRQDIEQLRVGGIALDARAAETFAASTLDVFRKKEWAKASQNPEQFSLRQCFPCIKEFIDSHPTFASCVGADVAMAKSIAVALVKGNFVESQPMREPGVRSPVELPRREIPLFRAIQAGNDSQIPELKTYLQQGGVGQKDEQGNSAIHHVALSGHHLYIPTLLAHHFSISDSNAEGQTALHIAIARGHIATAEALLAQNINVQVIDREGRSALMMAVIHGRAELIPTLLEHGASLQEIDAHKCNLFHLAADHNQLEVMQQLVTLMAGRLPLDEVDDQGRTVLHCVCKHDNPDMLNFLSQCGVNLRAEDADGVRPLAYACNRGHINLVKAYLELDDEIPTQLVKDLALSDSPNAQQIRALFTNRQDQQHARASDAPKKHIIRNFVCQGGGPKGYAYLGAIEELFVDAVRPDAKAEPGTFSLNDIERMAGTSAGAITAALLAVGNRHGQITTLLTTTTFTKFLDGSYQGTFLEKKKELQALQRFGWGDLLNQLCSISNLQFLNKLRTDFGLFAGEKFRTWMERQLTAATGIPNLTFRELDRLANQQPKKFKKLFIIATNLATSCAETFSNETTPDVIVSDAVRMSMSIPFLFVPHQPYQKIDGRRMEIPGSALYIDGGVQENYAIGLFDDFRYRDDVPEIVRTTGGPEYNPQTLGLRLVDISLKRKYESKGTTAASVPVGPASRPDGFKSFMLGTVNTFLNQQESNHGRSFDDRRTVYIDMGDVSVLDFDLSAAQKNSLLNAARVGVMDYRRRVKQYQPPVKMPKALLMSLADHCKSSQLLVQVNADGSLTVPSLSLQRQAPALVYEFYSHGPAEIAIFKTLGIPKHSIDPAGHTALHLAIQKVDLVAIENLLADKFNVNLPSKLQEYPLDVAWNIKDVPKRNAIVKQLIKAGAKYCNPSIRGKLVECCQRSLDETFDADLRRQMAVLRSAQTPVSPTPAVRDAKEGPGPDEKHRPISPITILPSMADRQAVKRQIETTPTAPSLEGLDEMQQVALLTTSSQEILPGLFLGDYEAYRRISQGKDRHFSTVIKVTAQSQNDPKQETFYAPLPDGIVQVDIGMDLEDAESSWPVLRARLPQALQAIDQALQSRQKVLVYCTQGVSRSVAVVIAYLCTRYGVSIEKANNFIKTKRPQIETRFLPALKQSEAEFAKEYRQSSQQPTAAPSPSGFFPSAPAVQTSATISPTVVALQNPGPL